MDILKHNETAWDNYVSKGNRWTLPVSEKEIEDARSGKWSIVLTPLKPVPHDWFPKLKNMKVLGLASGGGQQGPILAAVGAEVTIFDNSQKQLNQDQTISDRYGLNIKTIKGDMRNMSVFPDGSFDLIFNPCSVVFVDDVKAVWKECSRVLKPGGILMTGLVNPVLFQMINHNGEFKLEYKQPYSDLHSTTPNQREKLMQDKEAMEFGHSFTGQLGGMLQEGFVITDLYEDHGSHEKGLDEFLPLFMAIRAKKL